MTVDMGDLSVFEIEAIEHALGLDRSKTATRNLYSAGPEDALLWEGLVDKGLAFEVADPLTPDRVFMVSLAGRSMFGVQS